MHLHLVWLLVPVGMLAVSSGLLFVLTRLNQLDEIRIESLTVDELCHDPDTHDDYCICKNREDHPR